MDNNYAGIHVVSDNNLIFDNTITNNKWDGIFLYGKNLCGTCPAGGFIYRINENKNMIYIVSEDFSSYDMENLRYSFDIKGKVIKGETEINNFLKKITSCSKVNNIRKNFYVELEKNNKIKKIKMF